MFNHALTYQPNRPGRFRVHVVKLLTAYRLIESINLETDEALLTGESLPVAKVVDQTFDVDLGAGDRLNLAYSSSTVTKGRARGVVVATVS
jgi:magnesium-transporting ATPase (P-type)